MTYSRTFLRTAVAGLMAIGVMTAPVGDSISADDEEPVATTSWSTLSPDQQTQAVLSRNTFGLTTTDRDLDDLAADSEAVYEYGALLSSDELAHVEQWLDFEERWIKEIEPTLGQTAGYNGYYFERGEDIGVRVVISPATARSSIQALLGTAADRVSFEERPFNYETSLDWSRTISDAWEQFADGVQFSSISLATDWSHIEIATPEVASDGLREGVEKFASTLPGSPIIKWTIAPLDTAQSCNSRTDCHSPMRAGIRLNGCTMGFHIQLGSDEQFVTSGHCGPNGGTKTYTHSGYGTVGSTTSDLWNSGYDAERVQISDSQDSNRLYGWATSSNITGSRNPGPAETICSSFGYSNHVQCGSIRSTSTSYTLEGQTLYGADHDGISVTGGDSGSPLHRTNDAIGIHSSFSGKFALMQDVLYIWGAQVRT